MNLQEVLLKCNPTISFDEIVVEVNKIYHSFEAESYDRKHPEVIQQLPPIWKTMLEKFIKKKSIIRVLDYGCGTGFECQQLIKNIPNELIQHITLFDASPEMLRQCKSKLSGCNIDVKFTDTVKQIHCTSNLKYNVLLTNSLLHHLPHPFDAIKEIEHLLAEDCIWFCGHEPSKRFYKNKHCTEVLNRYRRERNIVTLLTPSLIWKKIKQHAGIGGGIAEKTAEEAVNRGLFTKKPKSSIIGLIVDYHVAHTSKEANEGRGFCFHEIEKELAGRWNLAWKTTYSFMGSFYEGSLPEKWQKKCRDLAEKYPDDGANFSSVWTRKI